MDRFDAHHLPVRSSPVGRLLLPQLSGQPNHLQPALHTLQGMFPRARVLSGGGCQGLAAVPPVFTEPLRVKLQNSGRG